MNKINISISVKCLKWLILACFGLSLVACTRIDMSIKDYSVKNDKGKSISFYICTEEKNTEPSNKLLLYIQGSGRFSVKEYGYRGAPAVYLGYDVLFIEKYGYDDKKLFYKTNSFERRINDINFVLNHVKEDIYKNKLTEVAVMADSDGGVIAPKIASNIPNLSGLIVLGAGGLPQKKEFEIFLEKEMAQEKGQGAFEYTGIFDKQDLQDKFQDIKDNPREDLFWLGRPYKIWASALEYDPIPYIKKLKVPVLYIIGDKDYSVPIESFEYLKNQVKDYDNFEFHLLPGVNHNFVDVNKNKEKMSFIIRKIIIPWYKKNKDKLAAAENTDLK
ncbi:MAG: alpha/beta hydrolase [Bacteroidetes bacterium]|nr:alpha/beta hydrolase [Bacteroidota bacterium]